MDFDKHFTDPEPAEFEIEEGMKFTYRRMTGGQSNEWTRKYIKRDPETGEAYQDFGMLNLLKLGNILSVPYPKDVIKKWMVKRNHWQESDPEKEFSEMNLGERQALFGCLTDPILAKITQEMNKADRGDEVREKKS